MCICAYACVPSVFPHTFQMFFKGDSVLHNIVHVYYRPFTAYDMICLDGFQLWDASTGQGVFQYNEHEKRAWSVDFSQVYPTKLASGSDDCSVKLWSINEACSLSLIFMNVTAQNSSKQFFQKN